MFIDVNVWQAQQLFNCRLSFFMVTWPFLFQMLLFLKYSKFDLIFLLDLLYQDSMLEFENQTLDPAIVSAQPMNPAQNLDMPQMVCPPG